MYLINAAFGRNMSTCPIHLECSEMIDYIAQVRETAKWHKIMSGGIII